MGRSAWLDNALSRSGLHSIPTEITQVQETITFFFVTRVAVVPLERGKGPKRRRRPAIANGPSDRQSGSEKMAGTYCGTGNACDVSEWAELIGPLREVSCFTYLPFFMCLIRPASRMALTEGTTACGAVAYTTTEPRVEIVTQRR